MKLSRKTFLYSILLSSLLVGMIVLYFAAMLPSLYVDYMKKLYLNSVVEVHNGYLKTQSYADLKVQNPTGSATLEIPLQGDTIYLTGKGFRFTLTVRDETIRLVLKQIRNCFQDMTELQKEDVEEIDWNLLMDTLTQSSIFHEDSPFELKMEIDEEEQDYSRNGTTKIHLMGQELVVLEASAWDSNNQYTTYLAMGKTDTSLVFSILPVMTPQMKEIKPIILQSLPMIAAVLFLIVLICSQYFSGKIVHPIIRLANYAGMVKNAGNLSVSSLPVTAKDEIGELGRTLNELYGKLRENYRELEEKNCRLEKENERQEIFLRASSHQLKTPVTAALLLVEGMIGEVGRYKDTKTHLPRVKEQLLSMQRIVEDILHLNHLADNLRIEPLEIVPLLSELLASYEIQRKEKALLCSVEAEGFSVSSDRELLKKILDNLISNAVCHTARGGSIRIWTEPDTFCIENRPSHIPDDILPHVYDPFVSTGESGKGRGLGLYIAAYYGEILGFKFQIENTEAGVLTALHFPESHTPSSYELHTEALK